MTKNEALQMAIEQLNVCLGLMATKDYNDEFYTNMRDVIKDCTKALKQPKHPKEPQYLYVSKGDNGKPELSFIDHQESVGKIKLEVDDD